MDRKLNIGCGSNWENYLGYEGLDIIDYGQEYVIDILKFFIGGVPKIQFVNQFDEVMANHFLEHFNQEQLKVIFAGVYEVLKKGGIFKFVVPHKDRERAWCLTHKTFWNEWTVKFLGTEDASKIYGFGKWRVKEIITNNRKDIHAWLVKK